MCYSAHVSLAKVNHRDKSDSRKFKARGPHRKREKHSNHGFKMDRWNEGLNPPVYVGSEYLRTVIKSILEPRINTYEKICNYWIIHIKIIKTSKIGFCQFLS